MRIRKRQAPFPVSSLSPIPLSVSDPHFNRSPVVQLQHQTNPHGNLAPQPQTATQFDPRPSDRPNHPIGEPNNGCDSSGVAGAHGEDYKKKQDGLVMKLQEGERGGDGGDGERSNDSRKKSVLGAEVGAGSLPNLISSRQAVGGWGEGEKAFPLKKRRGSFERRANDAIIQDTIMEKDKKVNAKMKTKMNKKCVQQNDNEEQDHQEKEKDSIEIVSTNTTAKKRGRGGALMEGSRCSRVNGRGWRCCQQTLVGYSLCEHHLGKGRLRSMTSVRSRSLASSAASNKVENEPAEPFSSTSLSLSEKQLKRVSSSGDGENGNGGGEEDDHDEDEKARLTMSTKKRVKLGMVKARSISSLLGQTNKAIAVADDNSK